MTLHSSPATAWFVERRTALPGSFAHRCINHEAVFTTTDRAEFVAHLVDAHKGKSVRGVPVELPKPKRSVARKSAVRKPVSVKAWEPDADLVALKSAVKATAGQGIKAYRTAEKAVDAARFAVGAWVRFNDGGVGSVDRIGQVWCPWGERRSVVVPVDGVGVYVTLDWSEMTPLGYAEPEGLFAEPAVVCDDAEFSAYVAGDDLLAELLGGCSVPVPREPVDEPPTVVEVADPHTDRCVGGCDGECVEREATHDAERAEYQAAYREAYRWATARVTSVSAAVVAEWAQNVAGGYLDEARAMNLDLLEVAPVPSHGGRVDVGNAGRPRIAECVRALDDAVDHQVTVVAVWDARKAGPTRSEYATQTRAHFEAEQKTHAAEDAAGRSADLTEALKSANPCFTWSEVSAWVGAYIGVRWLETSKRVAGAEPAMSTDGAVPVEGEVRLRVTYPDGRERDRSFTGRRDAAQYGVAHFLVDNGYATKQAATCAASTYETVGESTVNGYTFGEVLGSVVAPVLVGVL